MATSQKKQAGNPQQPTSTKGQAVPSKKTGNNAYAATNDLMNDIYHEDDIIPQCHNGLTMHDAHHIRIAPGYGG